MNVTQESIKKQAGDFLYTFILEKELTVKNYGTYLPMVKAKRTAQSAYLWALAAQLPGDQDTNYIKMKNWVAEGIAEYYEPLKNPNTGRLQDATPRLVLYYLALGRPCGGKNWKKGVFGKDAAADASLYTPTEQKNILQDLGVELTKDDYALVRPAASGVTLQDQGPVFYDGQIIGRDVIVKNGQEYVYDIALGYDDKGKTTLKAASDISGIMGSGGGTDWGGTILNCMQIIAQMIPVIVNGVKSIKMLDNAQSMSGVNPYNVAPNQTRDGWATTSTASLASGAGLLIGGLAIGGYMLMHNDEKKPSKSKVR